MCFEIEIKTKAFATDVTFIWFLTSMDKLVPLKLWFIQERYVAAFYQTNKITFPMRDLMFTISSFVIKLFETLINLTSVFVHTVKRENYSSFLKLLV